MLVLLLVPQTSVAEMVRVTGRAALEAGNDTLMRRRALEDALYQASLAGGAEVDGFSLADQGVLAGEAVLLRPSSKILDFAVLREQKASSHYEVTIEDDAVETAAKLSARYMHDRFLPDKAIDVIDEAGAAQHSPWTPAG